MHTYRYDSFTDFFADKKAVTTIMDVDTGHTHFHHLRPWIACPKPAAELIVDDISADPAADLDVDFVIRQTHVEEDFAGLCKMLRLPVKASVPKFNVTGKKFPLSEEQRPVCLLYYHSHHIT